MTNEHTVKIHGKDYMTVAGRLAEAREEIQSINTEVISHATMVIIKATVVTKKGTFTGISAANMSKTIEKQSPYEVAETSAVGRALGFAGYGVIESGIATADEMIKATTTTNEVPPDPTDDWMNEPLEEKQEVHFCQMHCKDLKERGNGIWDHRAMLNEKKEFDQKGLWHSCQGKGWFLSER